MNRRRRWPLRLAFGAVLLVVAGNVFPAPTGSRLVCVSGAGMVRGTCERLTQRHCVSAAGAPVSCAINVENCTPGTHGQCHWTMAPPERVVVNVLKIPRGKK